MPEAARRLHSVRSAELRRFQGNLDTLGRDGRQQLHRKAGKHEEIRPMCIDVHLKRVWKSAGFDDMPEPSAKKLRSASKDVDLSSDAPPNSMLEQILGPVNGISARLAVVESKVNGNQIEKPVDNQRQLLDRSHEVQLTLLDKSAVSEAAADSAACSTSSAAAPADPAFCSLSASAADAGAAFRSLSADPDPAFCSLSADADPAPAVGCSASADAAPPAAAPASPREALERKLLQLLRSLPGSEAERRVELCYRVAAARAAHA